MRNSFNTRILFALCVGLISQVALTAQVRLDVLGDAKFRGKIDITASNTDTTSIFIGKNAGISDDGTDNDNIFIGTGAGQENTIGFRNTALGFLALNSNIDGNSNTAFGSEALRFNATGYSNTAIGVTALVANTAGFDNTAIGFSTLYNNTTGFENTATGRDALYYSTTGARNTADGFRALYLNETGYSNTAIGNAALYNNTTGYNNIAIGVNALYSNTTGFSNTANGSETLYSNITGSFNTANGYQALFANTTGNNNTANGVNALYSNTTGFSNTANGFETLYSNTTGIQNTANGINALYSNTTGFSNTANGYFALYSNTTGFSNTANGILALTDNTTGSNNTALGNLANVSAGDLTFAAAIGAFATVNASNKVRLGAAFISVVEGPVAYSFPSDSRFKRNVQEEVKGLEFILSLRPVTYQFEASKYQAHVAPDNQPKREQTAEQQAMEAERMAAADNVVHTGFLAQEVEAAAEKVGYQDFDGVVKPQNEKDTYGLRYSLFVVPLVKGMQEQQAQIEALKAKNADLESRLAKIEALLSEKNSSDLNLQSSDQARLDQNNPNPFNGQTQINYYLPASVSKAQLRITDASGRLLKVLELQGAGEGQVNLNTNDLPSGSYQYSLVVDGQLFATKQMVLTKMK